MPLHAAVRTLLSAAVLVLLAPLPLSAQGQRITYAGLRWGLPGDSVHARMAALGWQPNGTNPRGDALFRRDSLLALVLVADGGLEQVNVLRVTTPDRREGRLRELVDSLTAVYGPARTTAENGSTWGGTFSSLAAMSMLTDSGASAVVALAYLGPGAQREHDRRAGTPNPFPVLPNAWITLHQSGPRRMSIDTTAITAVGERVYRVRVRFDLTQTLEVDRIRFDAMVRDQDYDCARRRTRSRSLVLLLQGQPVDTIGQARWDSARADTPESNGLSLVCSVALEFLGR